MDAEHIDPPSAVPQPDEHDALLLDDLATASDLKTKVSEAWHEFARALAAVMPQLTNGTHVNLTLDPTASGTGRAVYEVIVARHANGDLGALAVGNAALPESDRLDRTAVAEMVILGWSPPGVVAGSGPDFGMVGTVADAARFAVTITKTLRDVYGAPHPAFLTYTALTEAAESGTALTEAADSGTDAQPVTIGPLGAARPHSSDGSGAGFPSDDGFAALSNPEMPLAERVSIVVAGLQQTTPESLIVDGDGDIGIRAGSAMVFVRVRDNPPLVDVFSPVLIDIEPTEKLYAKLSELTTKMPIGRLYHANKTVWASIPVFGRDFQATHLVLALQVMTGLADELDDRLHGEFGGRRFFGEGDTATTGDDTGTGMYL